MIVDNLNWRKAPKVKINNSIMTSAIIEDSSDKLSYYNADKYMITKYPIKTGDLIEYNGINYIAVSQIDRNIESRDETKHNNRVRIRQADFAIKMVIEDKLYKFPSIIEGDKFYIGGDNILPLSADAIQVTLPLTEVTRQLQKLDAFIRWREKWEIQGIDYTKDGLIILHCKVTGTGVNDDLENEIANRYKQVGTDKVDKLNGNITPILPFDEPIKPLPNIVSVATFNNIQVDYGTLIDDIILPSTVIATLDDTTTIELGVEWDKSSYNGEVTAIYTFGGTLELVEGITNTNNVMASIKVVVGEAPPEEQNTYTLIGESPYVGEPDDEIWYNNWCKYTVKKFINDIEVVGDFTFTLSDTKATLTEITSNSCKVKVGSVNGKHTIKLIITDVETGLVVIEKTINIMGR